MSSLGGVSGNQGKNKNIETEEIKSTKKVSSGSLGNSDSLIVKTSERVLLKSSSNVQLPIGSAIKQPELINTEDLESLIKGLKIETESQQLRFVENSIKALEKSEATKKADAIKKADAAKEIEEASKLIDGKRGEEDKGFWGVFLIVVGTIALPLGGILIGVGVDLKNKSDSALKQIKAKETKAMHEAYGKENTKLLNDFMGKWHRPDKRDFKGHIPPSTSTTTRIERDDFQNKIAKRANSSIDNLLKNNVIDEALYKDMKIVLEKFKAGEGGTAKNMKTVILSHAFMRIKNKQTMSADGQNPPQALKNVSEQATRDQAIENNNGDVKLLKSENNKIDVDKWFFELSNKMEEDNKIFDEIMEKIENTKSVILSSAKEQNDLLTKKQGFI